MDLVRDQGHGLYLDLKDIVEIKMMMQCSELYRPRFMTKSKSRSASIHRFMSISGSLPKNRSVSGFMSNSWSKTRYRYYLNSWSGAYSGFKSKSLS